MQTELKRNCQRITRCISCWQEGEFTVFRVYEWVGPLLKLYKKSCQRWHQHVGTQARHILLKERTLGVFLLIFPGSEQAWNCFVATLIKDDCKHSTRYCSSPPPLCLPWPVPNQFPSLLLCPTAAGVWKTVETLFGEWDHCCLSGLELLCVVFFLLIWLQPMCSLNHKLVFVQRYDSVLLAFCQRDSRSQHPNNPLAARFHLFTQFFLHHSFILHHTLL